MKIKDICHLSEVLSGMHEMSIMHARHSNFFQVIDVLDLLFKVKLSEFNSCAIAPRQLNLERPFLSCICLLTRDVKLSNVNKIIDDLDVLIVIFKVKLKPFAVFAIAP